jgi:hypothetical protein
MSTTQLVFLRQCLIAWVVMLLAPVEYVHDMLDAEIERRSE